MQQACVRCCRHLDDDGSDIEGHERVCRHEEIEQAADVSQVVHAVSKPGDEPTQGEEWRNFCSSQPVMYLLISLHTYGRDSSHGSGLLPNTDYL